MANGQVPERTLQLLDESDLSGSHFVRIVGSDGKSYRVAVEDLETWMTENGDLASSIDEITNLKADLGDLSNLETEDNSSIVSAINWLLENGGGTPATTYTITNNLTNVINSNEATSIRENRAYSATLSLAEGATLDSVTVTMGGIDITQTAWDSTNMTISIASVTNNVVITAKASVVEVVEATWSQFGAATRYGTQVIDARENDVHVIVPFDEDSQYIQSGTTSESVGFRIMAALYSDSEAETLVGYWYNNQINASYTSTTTEQLPFDTEWICPSGYYVKVVCIKASSAIFNTNTDFANYNRTNTRITLVTPEEPEVETLSNAQITDRDLLRSFSVNALSLTTDTVEDATSYAGVLEAAKNEWMLEHGGSILKIPLIIHTDQHSNMTPTNSAEMWETIDNMISWYDVSQVINLGDTTNSYENFDNPLLGDSSLEKYLEATEAIPFSKRIEIYGNHDCMQIRSGALTYIQHNQGYLHPYFKNVLARRTSDNGYFVTYDPYFNVKYVVYSNYDYIDSTNYEMASTEQYDFLIDEMSKNDGYDIIICGHVGLPIYRESIGALVTARYNKTSGTITDRLGVTHTYDFTNCENDLLVCLHGHSHSDDYNYSNTVLSQCFKNYYDSTRPIYFVIVDRENRQIKVWKVTNTPEYTTYTRSFDEETT